MTPAGGGANNTGSGGQAFLVVCFQFADPTPFKKITMAYSQKTIDRVRYAKKTPGNQLGRWAIQLNFPVTKIAYALGVTRQTVYNWFEGKDVFVAYQNRVEYLLSIMKTSATADEAWRRICKAYDLKP